MKKNIFNYLSSYSYDIYETNRLIVSSFLRSNKIDNVKNEFISSFIINQDDSSYTQLNDFYDNYQISTIDDLISVFEFVLSPEEKVVTGAIYTPVIIRNFIIDNILTNKDLNTELKLCDPACGCGGFLYTFAKKMKEKTNLSYNTIYSKFVYGVDLAEYSILRCKILLCLAAILEGEDLKYFSFNLYVGNSLGFDWSNKINNFAGFDFVVGNPPYVCSRNLDEESKKLLSNWSVSLTGHPDLYIPFFELGISLLNNSGTLGYITMNSFFKSLNGRALRKYFHEKAFTINILDFFGLQVFESRSTYTCICLIKKQTSKIISYKRLSSLEKLNMSSFNKVKYSELDHYNGWNFNHFDLVNKIESIGTPFGKIFKTSSGIATLKNNIFIFEPTHEDDGFYYFKSNKIEKLICLDIINPNKLIDLSDVNSIKRKIIFPYRYNGKKASLITLDEFSKNYPNAFHYLSNYRDILSNRDKGKGNYAEWYAYGRNQGLEKIKYKLFFPHITYKIPNFVLSNDALLLFHNGMSLISSDRESLILASKIMQSRIFWFYIINTSKPYGSGYFSLSKNYIKSFGVYDFTDEQKQYLINEKVQSKVDKFLEQLYDIDLSHFLC